MKTSSRSKVILLVALVLFCARVGIQAATFTPTTTTDVAISSTAVVNSAGQITNQGNAITLRSAVIAANALGGTNSITLGGGIYQLTIPGTGETASSGDATIGDLDVLAPASGRNTLTVQGAGAALTTIQQTTGIDRVFDVHPVNLAGSVTFNLTNVTVTGGHITTASGGAILTGRAGDVTTLTNCVFDGNISASNGGAITQSSGSASHDLTITNCVFKNNTATGAAGGAVNYAGIGTVTITGTTFSSNTSGTAGGAVNVTGTGTGGIYNISTCNFFSNTCNDTVFGGGAISGTQGQSLNVHFCRFTGNLAPNITPGATTGKVIGFGGGTLTNANVFVNQNWWGANSGPAAFDVSQITPTQWLQLRVTASPNPILINGTTTVTADILGQNTGGPTAASNLTGLPAFPAAPTTIFSSPVKGTLSGASTQFVDAQATATFTAGTVTGIGGANAAVDSQAALTASITINQPPAITSVNSANFTVGVNGSFTVTTTGFPTPGIVRTGVALPTGVTFTDNANGTGTLTGTPAAGTGGTYNITFTASNGVGSNAVQPFTLRVNGPPVVSNIGKSGNEDTPITFSAADFNGGYADPNSDPLTTVRITSLPANGVLKNGATTISAVPSDIAIGNIANLTYTPTLNYNGADSFGWNGSDGVLFAASAALVNITIAAVNDKPTFTAANPPAVNEDAGAQSVVGWVTNFNPGATNESAQTVLAYIVSNVSNAALFSAGPSVANNGTLTYTPAANANGTSTFQVRVQDNGGTALGGIDLSDPQTFTITVNAVNDPPVITGQNAISTAYTTARAIAFADLLVTDVDNPYPTGFTLSVQNGVNYTRSGNTITPVVNFFGTLSVPAKVNDGTSDSNVFNLVVTVNPDPAYAKAAASIAPEPGGGWRISFIGNPGQTYTIQFTTGLAPVNWQFLGTRTADSTGHYSIVDIPPLGTPQRFYHSIFP